MRKFLIILCGILITQAGFAGSRTLQTPNPVTSDTIKNAWGMPSGSDAWNVDSYTDDVKSMFSISGFYNTYAGTYGTNDEGSIIPIIARNIYEHGGYFCMTQIQAAYGSDSNVKHFIDYFKHKDGKYLCQPVCEDGWSGDRCATHSYDCSKPNIDYTKDLNNTQDGNLRITSGEQSSDIRITNKVEVFWFNNGGSDRNSNTCVLGVLRQNKHSIKVAPVVVKAYNEAITGAWAMPGNYKVLCAPGYTLDSTGEDCTLALECDPNYVAPCDNVTPSSDKYDEDEHEKLEKTGSNGKKCWYIRCKSGKGFDPEEVSQGTCKSCVQGPKIGVNSTTGVCDSCLNPGEFFDDGQCRPAKYQISNLQMSKGPDYMNADNDRECWRESDIAKFKNCVMCDQGKCYNEESHNCGNCP